MILLNMIQTQQSISVTKK